MNEKINVFWFRRDLRLEDNKGLYHALNSKNLVLPVFIFDQDILSKLEDPSDVRVSFIHQTIGSLKEKLQKTGHDLKVYYGKPLQVFQEIIAAYPVDTIFTNHDEDAYAIERDQTIEHLANRHQIGYQSFKDHVIFEKSEIVKEDGKPYTIFTPYSRKWKAALNEAALKNFPSETFLSQLLPVTPQALISLGTMHFTPAKLQFPPNFLEESLVKKYTVQRDFPSLKGTSRLGVHLRFGTISIRSVAKRALQWNETFLNELIWRDFYHMISFHFPHIHQGLAFRKEYDRIPWRNDPEDFEKWCNGQTGYPIVDAGMRELNTTGFMHNRVRMIVASFLTKHLLIDWRLGEAYFAKKLLDFDFAANNGGWQWASGSGCDAAPYFRIFNPYLQTKRFDPKLDYIKKWVPELDTPNYPPPMVAHELARKRCLEVYAIALKKA